MTDWLAALCLGSALGALVLALWPRPAAPPRPPAFAFTPDDRTPRTLH